MFQAIDLGEFEERTGLVGRDFVHQWNGAACVVSLRDITKVLAVQVMPLPYLFRLLESVTLAGDPSVRIYKDCTIRLVRSDPHQLLVGQTFVEKHKCWSLLNNFKNIFADFCVTRGTAKCGALIVLGETVHGLLGVAHYIPPLVELHSVGHALLDGLHRSFLQKNVGTTGESVLISGVPHRFPCALHDWKDVRSVDVKPPKEERFFDLVPELFRDVKHVGIDG